MWKWSNTHLSTKADPTSSYLNHNKNNECVTKGWNFCLKLKDCHCQASSKTTGTPVGTQLFQACVKPALLGKGPWKCALAQLDEYYKANAPIPDYQSAYREHYSCKNALAKLVNDLLWSMEEGCVTSFVAIDLSAVFDMVSHDIPLDLLGVQYGVIGKALAWSDSYLHLRNFKVNVNGTYSKPISLEYSVPHGSCLGPVAYLLYASSMEEVIASPEPHTPAPNNPENRSPTVEKIDLHGYADDHAIKKKFELICDKETVTTKLLSDCLTRKKLWMDLNRLKMNNAKTEYIQFGSRQQLAMCTCDCIDVNGIMISRSDFIKYLGANLDRFLSMKQHIKQKYNTTMLNLYRIKHLRHCLTSKTC